MKKNIFLVTGLMAVAALVSSCTAGADNPGVEYAPDMYVSKGYEPMSKVADKEYSYITIYGDTVFLNTDGKTMREPVKNTIPMDLKFEAGSSQINNYLAMQYAYPAGDSGKTLASANLKNPITKNAESLANGRKAYMTYCMPCHGADGKGDGLVAAKFPPNNIPPYEGARVQALTDGAMYHSITHGTGNMGSYASVLTPQQRWEVIHYVNFLRKK